MRMSVQPFGAQASARTRGCWFIDLLLLLMIVAGCDSSVNSSSPTTPAKDGPAPPAQVPQQTDLAADKAQAMAAKFAAERTKARRKEVLEKLGEVKSWQVSTTRKGMVDEAVAKMAETGAYEKALNEAFSHLGLELRGFLYLPAALAELRRVKPTPETCDLIVAKPIEYASIQPHLGNEIVETSDTDSEGHPRKWYQVKEVSFGVVDGRVTVVRLNLSLKVYEWQQIGTPK